MFHLQKSSCATVFLAHSPARHQPSAFDDDDDIFEGAQHCFATVDDDEAYGDFENLDESDGDGSDGDGVCSHMTTVSV
mgnify:CR=1 FL=1